MQAQVSAAAANRDQVTAGPDATQIADAEAQAASAQAQYKTARDTHDRTMICKTFTLPDGTKPDDTEVTICPGLGPPEEQTRYNMETAEAALVAAQAQLNELLDGTDAYEIRAAQANVLTVAAQRNATQAELDLLLAGHRERVEHASALRFPPGLRDVVDLARRAALGLLQLPDDEPLPLQFLEQVVDGGEPDIGPLAHPAFLDHLLDLVAIPGLFGNEAQNGQFRVRHYARFLRLAPISNLQPPISTIPPPNLHNSSTMFR